MPELEFDLKKMTARDMAVFQKAARENDVEALAGVLARVVVNCPKEWGKPNEAETFLNLPYYGEFLDVIGAMVQAGQNRAKN